MKYIVENEAGYTSYDKYFEYIKSIKQFLSEGLFSFANDPERYDLRNKKSLHDAWIESIEVNYCPKDDEVREINISLTLLGQYHDRKHHLLYSDVHSYIFKNINCKGQRNNDLLLHEIRFEDNLIEHEILFDKGVVLLIICTDITHTETMTQ